MPIKAERSGECERCDEGIRPGQRVETTASGAWAHVACPMPREICPTCWTQKSVTGACMCEGN